VDSVDVESAEGEGDFQIFDKRPTG
jgi:hypothetical protein